MPSLKQGIRGCVTTNFADPTRRWSPIRTSSSSKPSMVRFSPKTPQGRSVWGSSRHNTDSARMVAGGQVFRHPSCQNATPSFGSRHPFTPITAVRWFKSWPICKRPPTTSPRASTRPRRSAVRGDATEYPPTAMRTASAGRDSARSLGQAGGECCRLELEGGERPQVTVRAEEPNNALWPLSLEAFA